MKRIVGVLIAAGVGAWLVAQNQSTPKPLAELTPAGAMLYLEARNFNALLNDWGGSGEKKAWLASDNHQVFSRSRLYLRLQQVFEEYSKATGVPPDMTLLHSIAGGETAIAIYDISNVEFLYLTRLPSARAMDSVLWKAKERFAVRNAAGSAYYIKTDAATRRTAAFAIAGDLLLIATREEALAGALALIRGTGSAVRQEAWFEDAARATGAPGELRMVSNMEKLTRTPSFRSYWIQRNTSDLRQFYAGIDDLARPAGEVREERVLLRQEPVAAPEVSAVAGLLRLVSNAGLYRAWAQPHPDAALALLTRKVLRPGMNPAAESRSAPQASVEAVLVGEESDLETAIDGAPYEPPGVVYRPGRLASLLAGNRPRALLQMQSSRLTADRVFVMNDSVVAMEGSADWDLNAVKEAVVAAVEGLYTTSRLGVVWRERRVGNDSIWELDGLGQVALMVKGRVLLASNRGVSLEPLLPLLNAQAAGAGSVYAAGYRVPGELSNYTRIMQLIEAPQSGAGNPGEPQLFSANLSSLARTLQRVESASVLANDDGRAVKQTVSYRLVR